MTCTAIDLAVGKCPVVCVGQEWTWYGQEPVYKE